MPKPIPDETRQAILKTLKKTHNQSQTAKQYQVSLRTVQRLAKKAGVEVLQTRPRKYPGTFIYVRPAMFTRKPKTTSHEPQLA